MLINPMYTKKVSDLVDALIAANIPHETEIMRDAGGYIVYFPDKKNRKGDVILHNFSYGHEYGGFEGYEGMSYVDGDVCIFDTVEQVVEYAKKQNFIRVE